MKYIYASSLCHKRHVKNSGSSAKDFQKQKNKSEWRCDAYACIISKNSHLCYQKTKEYDTVKENLYETNERDTRIND